MILFPPSFSPLSSPNRLVYWDCIHKSFSVMDTQLSFGIEREIPVEAAKELTLLYMNEQINQQGMDLNGIYEIEYTDLSRRQEKLKYMTEKMQRILNFILGDRGAFQKKIVLSERD